MGKKLGIVIVGSQRLSDMADVEKIASQQVAPGMAERLVSIANTLVDRKNLIDSIELIDKTETFARCLAAHDPVPLGGLRRAGRHADPRLLPLSALPSARQGGVP